MAMLDSDLTIADVQSILKNLGLEASREEIGALWRTRPATDLRRALQEHRDERWARTYIIDALSDARRASATRSRAEANGCSVRSTTRGTPRRPPASGISKMPYRSSVPSVFGRVAGLCSAKAPSTALEATRGSSSEPCGSRRELIVCGATAAFRFEPASGANGAAAVLVGAAPACSGRRYDWAKGIDFLLEWDQLPTVLMVVTGHLPEASFSCGAATARKFIHVADQRSQVQASIRCGSDTRTLSVGPMQALALAALITAQVEASLTFLPRGDISLLIRRTVGRMTAAVLPVPAKANAPSAASTSEVQT